MSDVQKYIEKNFPKAFHKFLIELDKSDTDYMGRLWMDASVGDCQMYQLIDMIRDESKKGSK